MTDSQKLRAIADFLESHEGLSYQVPNLVVAQGKDEMLRVAHLPGAKKRYSDAHFYVDVPIEGVTLTYFTSRESVCTPVKTEDELVPAQPSRIRTKVVEWECHPLLKPDYLENTPADLTF